MSSAPNPLETFLHSFPVDGEVANLLPTSYFCPEYCGIYVTHLH